MNLWPERNCGLFNLKIFRLLFDREGPVFENYWHPPNSEQPFFSLYNTFFSPLSHDNTCPVLPRVKGWSLPALYFLFMLILLQPCSSLWRAFSAQIFLKRGLYSLSRSSTPAHCNPLQLGLLAPLFPPILQSPSRMSPVTKSPKSHVPWFLYNIGW